MASNFAVRSMSWRDTLFIWRGDIVIEAYFSSVGPKHPSGKVQFKGRWVGVADAADARDARMPPDDAFRASSDEFDVIGKADALDVSGDGTYVFDEEGPGKGWMLDQGDGAGRRWYRDREHKVKCVGNWVFAKGHNEFASFVSVGALSGYAYQQRISETEEGSSKTVTIRRQLTLARRYLDDRDVRCGWDTSEMARHFVCAEKPVSEKRMPWMVEVMHAKKLTAKGQALANKRKRETAASAEKNAR